MSSPLAISQIYSLKQFPVVDNLLYTMMHTLPSYKHLHIMFNVLSKNQIFTFLKAK